MTTGEWAWLAKLISPVISMITPLAKSRLEQSQVVIALREKMGFPADHPPADFRGVYAYAIADYVTQRLVTLGDEKLKKVLALLTLPEIADGMRSALNDGEVSSLLEAGENACKAFAIGDELREAGVDEKAELTVLYTAFQQVVAKTRLPKEVALTLVLNEVDRKVDGITKDVAKLVEQTRKPSPLHELEAHLEGWFEALHYEFENHRVEMPDYFERIIRITQSDPIRRRHKTYRIVVRGDADEIKLSDLTGLRNAVATHRADGGWLIANRRVSPAVKKVMDQPENEVLKCCTFDELIDEDADFSQYLEWLEGEIKRLKIDERYVALACCKDEIDSRTQQRMGKSQYEDIDDYVAQWIDDPAKEHVSILGEFGTGKTWFTLHYAEKALQEYK